MGICASFETDMVKEARVKADKNRKEKKAKKKGKGEKEKKPTGDRNITPMGGEIGATGVFLWVKNQFKDGSKSLTKEMETAATKANAVSGYTLPLYARKECMSNIA